MFILLILKKACFFIQLLDYRLENLFIIKRLEFSFSEVGIPFRAWICPFQSARFPFARGFVPFNRIVSLSRDLLSLSIASFPFRAGICPFQWHRFPFARPFVPFNDDVSLSTPSLSLSTNKIQFKLVKLSPSPLLTTKKLSPKRELNHIDFRAVMNGLV